MRMRIRRSPRVRSGSCAAWLFVLVLATGCKSGDKPQQGGAPPNPQAGSQPDKAASPRHGRLIMLGFDGVDPRWLERWIKEGKLPVLAKLTAAHDGRAYRHLHSTNPPQSPVAWTSFATGTPPGEHGIYDFIARTLNTERSRADLAEGRDHVVRGAGAGAAGRAQPAQRPGVLAVARQRRRARRRDATCRTAFRPIRCATAAC